MKKLIIGTLVLTTLALVGCKADFREMPNSTPPSQGPTNN